MSGGDGESNINFLDELELMVSKQEVDNDDVIHMYNKSFASYEKDTDNIHFNSVGLAVHYFHKHAQRFGLGKECVILDVAAGTGRVGNTLKRDHGYTTLDAIDASDAMLTKAREKNIYRNVFVGKVGYGDMMPVGRDSYDAAIVSAALAPGHLPVDAFLDIIRVVKPGGIIVNVMREVFSWLPYQDIRTPFSDWQAKGHWDVVEWTIPAIKYGYEFDALVHVYRISQ